VGVVDDVDSALERADQPADDGRATLAAAFGVDRDPLRAHAATFASLDNDVDPFALFETNVLNERDPATSTRRGYRRAIDQWRTYMADQGRHPAWPNETHVRGFARHRKRVHGNRPATILTKLHRLHRIFRYWQDDPAFPHTQAWAVGAVVEQLGTTRGVELDACLELRRISEFLLEFADEACIGPGTPRVAVAAAVYAADRLTDGKAVTQAAMAVAASEIVPTSKRVIAGYSREAYDAYTARYGTREVDEVLTGRLA
jgi:hypothetical protein